MPLLQVPMRVLQQPPLQGCELSQVGVQKPAALHAVPVGQSAGLRQPHCPEMHAWPLPLAEQSTQATPYAPHAVVWSPRAHAAPSQQPPLQGLVPEQTGPQVPPVQAWPEAHSVWSLQPQAPAMHSVPADPSRQSTQAPPSGPQLPLEMARQVFCALQQKPAPQVPAAPLPAGEQVAVHWPALQVGVPPPQGWQARPPAPQA
jgi:hypothetical protein